MNRKKVLLPVAVVLLGAVAAALMVAGRPEVERRRPETPAPLVRVITVKKGPHLFRVRTQGTVTPRTESTLVAEVAGRVLSVADDLADGAFFEEGRELLQIDPTDYRAAVTQARSTVAQARLALAQEEEARVAREEFGELGRGEATPLALREPQLERARAQVEAAKAALDRAERDLQRTTVRAPYDGRVRSRAVDVGQFVGVGTVLAQVFSVETAEVRLPLPPEELAYLDLPLDYRGALAAQQDPERLPEVLLSASYAGRSHTWRGRVERIEGEIDPATRMVHVVAAFDDPYGRHSDRPVVPLTAGLFVDAEVLGRKVESAAVLPREALRGDDQMLVVDDDGLLHFRAVEVLRAARDEVVVGRGLEEGERVCLSRLETATEGMEVRTLDESSTAPELGPAAGEVSR